VGTVVLTYHRVSRDVPDPYFLAVHPSRFAEHLSVIGRIAEPIALHGVLAHSRGSRVAITLDDGYADNVSEALPLLEAAGIPATVFVVSTMVGARREFWHHRLQRSIDEAPDDIRHLQLEIGGRTVTVDIGGADGRRRAMWALHTRMRPLPPQEIDRVLDDLAETLGTNEDGAERRAVNRDELRQLAASPIATVGAHTRRHAWLSSLDRAEQEREIVGCRGELEELVGAPVDLFAYPYGLARSYDHRTVGILRRRGFVMACTTHNEAMTPFTSRYRLPRKGVRNWDAKDFEKRLRGWLEE
jgi:peptidoglycan/xylan/chitin deacetylase (PgdA/CDA1 family)